MIKKLLPCALIFLCGFSVCAAQSGSSESDLSKIARGMKTMFKKICVFLLLCGSGHAQSTAVSATVQDSNGVPYSFCTVQATLVLVGGAPVPSGPTFGVNQPVPTPVAANCDVNGTFLMGLIENTLIDPAGTVWQFRTNAAGAAPPIGTGPQSFTVGNVSVAGASQDISAALNAAAPRLTTIGVGSISSVFGLTGAVCAAGADGQVLGWAGGTCQWQATGVPVNAQTGATYTVLASDKGKLVTHSNAGAIAVTLPQAIGSFAAPFFFYVCSIGAGTTTITPTVSTINTAASKVLARPSATAWACAMIVSDGTNYRALDMISGGGSGVGTIFGGAILNDTIAAAATSFWSYDSPTADNTEAARATVIAASCTARNLRIQTTNAQPGDGTLVITLRDNTGAADTSLTVTVAAGAAAGIYSDTTNAPALTGGSKYVLKAVNGSPGTVSATVLSISWQCN